MTDSGVSKKVFVVILSINTIAQMAADEPNKWPYAVIIGIICVAYKITQSILDRSKNNGTKLQ